MAFWERGPCPALSLRTRLCPLQHLAPQFHRTARTPRLWAVLPPQGRMPLSRHLPAPLPQTGGHLQAPRGQWAGTGEAGRECQDLHPNTAEGSRPVSCLKALPSHMTAPCRDLGSHCVGWRRAQEGRGRGCQAGYVAKAVCVPSCAGQACLLGSKGLQTSARWGPSGAPMSTVCFGGGTGAPGMQCVWPSRVRRECDQWVTGRLGVVRQS